MAFNAKENIILSFFENWKDHLSRLLKYHESFVNVKERSSFPPTSFVEKDLLLLPQIYTTNISLSEKILV